jgi:hypothetical protein
MKKAVLFSFIMLLFTVCRPTERMMEEVVYCLHIERNYSTYNLFMQYYLNDGTIMRKKIYQGTENRIDTDYNSVEMSENNFYHGPDADLYFNRSTNLNAEIQKILIIDMDTNTIIKRLEHPDNLYSFGFAEYWAPDVKREYWILDITNEWLINSGF